MRKDDVLGILGVMNPSDISTTVLVLKGGSNFTLDQVIRAEADYLVFRGREGGTTDEGRAFFVPYEEISYIKLDRVVRINQIRRMYGETVALDSEERFEKEQQGESAPAEVVSTPAPTAPTLDPAAIAKQNLLERIRAARTSAGNPKPR